ncbi:MAG: hypothetical protein HQM08_25165 [Candidatus Riflebacteria bacterium]|nr:hypothetical protein [Candidatus Riflebacteria bacterium]
MPSSHPVSMDSNPQHSLEQIKEKFSEWRNAESRSHKIPEELWSAAVSLIPSFSINRISRELSLGFTELKSRALNTDFRRALNLRIFTPKSRRPFYLHWYIV